MSRLSRACVCTHVPRASGTTRQREGSSSSSRRSNSTPEAPRPWIMSCAWRPSRLSARAGAAADRHRQRVVDDEESVAGLDGHGDCAARAAWRRYIREEGEAHARRTRGRRTRGAREAHAPKRSSSRSSRSRCEINIPLLEAPTWLEEPAIKLCTSTVQPVCHTVTTQQLS